MTRLLRRRPGAWELGAAVAAAAVLLIVGRASAAEPTTQASSPRIAGQGAPAVNPSLVVMWTNGSGAESLVVMRQSSPVNADPADGTTYTASTTFGTGGSEIGTGNWVVYAGTGTSVTVTVPRSDLPYHVAVYSYDPTDHNYLQVNPARYNSGHNANHAITDCYQCHFGTGPGHGTNVVPRNASQETKCKSCHTAGQVASAKADINLHQGTKYLTSGKMVDCGSCHDVHNAVDFMTTDTHTGGQTATNVNWLRKNVSKYAADWTTGTPVEALYQATTGFFAFDETNSPWNGICQACHTGTDFHRNNSQVTHNHPSTPLPLCTNCHTHAGPPNTNYGWRPSGGACPDCHNSTQGSKPRRQIVQSGSGSGEFGGSGGGQAAWTSHHVNSGAIAQVVTKWDCVVCHAEGDVNTGETTSYHNNVPLGQTECNAPNPCPVDLKNVDTGTVLGVVAPDSSTDWRNLTAAQRSTFCMSCHDSDTSSGAGNGGAAIVAARPASPPAGDPDAADYTTVALNPFKDNVTNHHEPPGFNGTAAPHLRGQVVDVKGMFTTTNIAHHAVRGAAYTGTLPAGFGAGLTDAIKGGGTGTPRTDLAWNSTLNCEDCHADGGGGLDPNNKLNGHGTKNARYMLRDKNGVDTYPTPSGSGNLTVVCFRCHIPTGDPSSYDTSLSTYEVHTRGAHIDDTLNLYGISCLNCHGGGAFGAIHGWNAQVGDDQGGGSYNPNVFTIGAALDLVTNWTSWARRGVSCSAKASNTLLTQCTQHSSQTYTRGQTRTYRSP